MNVNKLLKWNKLNTAGIIGLFVLILAAAFGYILEVKREMVLGSLVALPWAAFAILAQLTNKTLFKMMTVLVPLLAGLFFLELGGMQNDNKAIIFKLSLYFSTVFFTGWFLIRIFIVIIQHTTKK
jgi:hypothetical protein